MKRSKISELETYLTQSTSNMKNTNKMASDMKEKLVAFGSGTKRITLFDSEKVNTQIYDIEPGLLLTKPKFPMYYKQLKL